MEDFYDEVLKEKEHILKDLIDILRVDTVLKQEYRPEDKEPFGKNLRDVLDLIENMAKRDGLKYENVLNHACEIEIGEGQEIFGILAHLDVVPATGKWINPPFEPIIREGKLYARGVIDDKGAAILCYYCLKILKKLKIKLNKRVRLILGVDEESGSRCIEKYLEVKEEPSMAFSPDADFPLIYGEKGILSFKICGSMMESEILSLHSGTRTNLVPDESIIHLQRNLDESFNDYLLKNHIQGEITAKNTYKFMGKSSHAMNPKEGVNSNFLLFNFLKEIGIEENLVRYFNQYLNSDFYGVKMGFDSVCPEMKELTLNVGTIHIENGNFEIGINIRYPFESDYPNVIQKVSDISLKFGYRIEQISHSGPHKVEQDSELVRGLLKAYEKYSKDPHPAPFTIGGGTYARMFKNGVAFGPVFKNREDVVHKENEYALLEDLWLACAIYLEGIYLLCA